MLREKLRKDWLEIKAALKADEVKAGARRLKIALGFMIAALVGVGLINIKRALPPELRGQLHASGRVVSCDIHSLNEHSPQFFVGITLDDARVPMIRANPQLAEHAVWDRLCAMRPSLDVDYHAQKLLVGDTYFWLDRYEVRR